MAGVDTVTALQFALVVGYGLMLVGFMRVLLIYFPSGEGSAFALSAGFARARLLITGFLGMRARLCTSWSCGSALWACRSRAHSGRPACLMPRHLRLLVTVPTNINFVVSIEVNFYGKYRQYFDAITGGGTIGQIAVAKDNMRTVLHQEVGKLVQIQPFLSGGLHAGHALIFSRESGSPPT